MALSDLLQVDVVTLYDNLLKQQGFDFFFDSEVDGTPVCELPLPGGDGARRYRIGCMQVY